MLPTIGGFKPFGIYNVNKKGGFGHKKDRFFCENLCCDKQRSTTLGAYLNICLISLTDRQMFLINLYNADDSSIV